MYDKAGLVELAQGLSELGWDLVASGNTAAKLSEVRSVESFSGNIGKIWAEV